LRAEKKNSRLNRARSKGAKEYSIKVMKAKTTIDGALLYRLARNESLSEKDATKKKGGQKGDHKASGVRAGRKGSFGERAIFP